MSDGFHRRRGGCVIATFTGFEGDLLRSLASQIVELLRSERAAPSSGDPLEQMLDMSGPTSEPEDPVLARLFPNAYRDDDEAAGEFRRFTEGALRDSKAEAAVGVIESLEEAGLPAEPDPGLAEGRDRGDLTIDVELDHDAAMSWVKSFTDIRLALATRLGVEEGDDDYWLALPDEDPRAHVYDIYQWVGYLQETLVGALSKSR